MRLKVAVRADASAVIGTGHVMRCLALAQELRDAGHDVVFVQRRADGGLLDVVDDRWGFEVLPLPPVDDGFGDLGAIAAWDAEQTTEALAGARVDWIVADHYGLGAAWERSVAEATGASVLALDDLARRDHACTLLLDANAPSADAYATLGLPEAALLLGPSYALVRREFRERPAPRRAVGRVRTVAVSFGGVDPTNQTSPTLALLRDRSPALERVIVVAGHGHPHMAELRAVADAWPAVDLHERVDDLATLLAGADLAIGAGGVSSLERLALGLPSVVIATAPNQVGPAEALAYEGALLYLGETRRAHAPTLAAALDAMDNAYLRAAMAQRGRRLVDGLGPRRVVRAMVRHTRVRVRPAEDRDGERLFAWRNHPRVRRASWDGDAIPWEDHRRWFRRALEDHDRHLLVAEVGLEPVGSVRYDVDRDQGRAIVSLYLAPEVHGSGLGHPVLTAADAWLAAREPQVDRVVAEVRGDNPASRRLFAGAGYRALRWTLQRDLPGAAAPGGVASEASGGSST